MTSVRTPSRPSETTSQGPDGQKGGGASVADKLTAKSTSPNKVKQVRLKLVYIDFWSAVKFSFLIAAAIGVVIVVAVLLIWTVLESTGIFGSVTTLLRDVSGSETASVNSIISFAQVMGFTVVIAALQVVVGTVLGAIACLLYNLSVKVTGGILVGFTNQ